METAPDYLSVTLKLLGALGLLTDVLVPYETLSNKLATEKCAADLGLGSFTYFNPLETNGKLDDVGQIPSLIEQTEQYRDDFLRVWNTWISR